MTADLAARLRALAQALPPETAIPVPAGTLLELLSGETQAPAPAVAPADLTVADLAERFGRHNSTVRQWVERGEFPGAYRMQAASGEFLWRPSSPSRRRPRGSQKPERQRRGKAVDLGAWRSAS